MKIYILHGVSKLQTHKSVCLQQLEVLSKNQLKILYCLGFFLVSPLYIKITNHLIRQVIKKWISEHTHTEGRGLEVGGGQQVYAQTYLDIFLADPHEAGDCSKNTFAII